MTFRTWVAGVLAIVGLMGLTRLADAGVMMEPLVAWPGPAGTTPAPPPDDLTTVAENYTFESPAFTNGSVTPLLNRAPNSGPAGFTASFTSAPTASGFTIAVFAPNPLLTGQVLYDPVFPADVLTITANQPIVSLSFAFATNTAQNTGRVALTSTAGNANQNSANVGGSFPGGTFNFAPANTFTSFTLSAFDASNVPTLLAIDNLTLNVVPEPSAATLLALAAAGSLMARRSSRQRR